MGGNFPINTTQTLLELILPSFYKIMDASYIFSTLSFSTPDYHLKYSTLNVTVIS